MTVYTIHGRLIHQQEIAGYSIELRQCSRTRFSVIYGKQIDTDLPYVTAAAKLGEAIMHALICEGKLDGDR